MLLSGLPFSGVRQANEVGPQGETPIVSAQSRHRADGLNLFAFGTV
jgi:hypothetical protein